MEELLKGDSGAVSIFLILLPGFAGTAAYDYLVEGPKREIFDRIVFSLSVTLVSSLLVGARYGTPIVPNVASVKDATIFSVFAGYVGLWMFRTTCVAIVLSVLLAVLNNYGVILLLAGRLRLTYKTSSVDVWQDVLYRFRGYWVRIAFKDGRVLIGWPRYFSAVGQPREMFVANATWWLKDADEKLISSNVDGPGVYIAAFDDVTDITLLK